MSTRQELEAQIEYLTNRTKQLETELAVQQSYAVRISPVYLALVKKLQQGPISIRDLASEFDTDSRTISQRLFQLKNRYSANIITLSDGRKELQNDPFASPDEVTE